MLRLRSINKFRAEHYKAVAEVIGYVMRVRRMVSARR